MTSGGEGFPPDKLEAVFNLFERGRSRARRWRGWASLCPSAGPSSRPRGGSIRAINPPEGGACVAFRARTARRPSMPNPSPTPENALRRATILVIEDELQIRRFVRTALEGEGLRVVDADTRRLGLQEAGRYELDLVILDLGLPDGDGAGCGGFPGVVLRAGAGAVGPLPEHDGIGVLDAGADDYLTKPFSIGELLAQVRAAAARAACAGERGRRGGLWRRDGGFPSGRCCAGARRSSSRPSNTACRPSDRQRRQGRHPSPAAARGVGHGLGR